ncbi:glycosyltransferase family 2 protein [Clostridium sp. CT7]|uniref:glycosyltransferase family 2 protein n=2 Tax=Clostridium TaxID=1485 RepID=UPI00082679BB|nr:glycosyltransferase family 2 protein [Clostridium sp. CT7]
MSLVFIIIVNYNAYKDTIECVKSLRKISYKNYKVIIVDNASTDESVARINDKLKDCILLRSMKNLGFAGGNNIGMRYALEKGADYVLLLNNDTLVERDFLSNMLVPFSRNTSIGMVGCKIMYYPEVTKIWFGGGKIDWFKFIGTHFGMREIDNGQCDDEKEIDFMTGCCILVKRKVIEKVGPLSEEYFMYFEDVDFCVRVKECGYMIWYEPKAVIYHKVGLSGGGEESAFSIRWCTRNRVLFMNKNRKRVGYFKFILSKAFFYFTRIIRYIQYYFTGNKEKAYAIVHGIRNNMNLNNKI